MYTDLYHRGTQTASTSTPTHLQEAERVLVPAAFDDVLAQHSLFTNYSVVPWKAGTWRVKRTDEALEAAKAKVKSMSFCRIGPTHFRERMVYIDLSSDGTLCLRCTCRMYEQVLLLCCHIFAVKRGQFDVAEDVHHEKFNAYAGGATDFTQRAFDDNNATGPGMTGVDEAAVESFLSEFTLANGQVAVPSRAHLEAELEKITVPGLTAYDHTVEDDGPAPFNSYSDFLERGTALIKLAATAVAKSHPHDPVKYAACVAVLTQGCEDIIAQCEDILPVVPGADTRRTVPRTPHPGEMRRPWRHSAPERGS